jgi:hypothetical protein
LLSSGQQGREFGGKLFFEVADAGVGNAALTSYVEAKVLDLALLD